MRGFEILDSGETLYVEENGSGPALICVHGLGGGAFFFNQLADYLKDRYRVIAFDLPGAGFSPCTAPFSFDRAAEMVLELGEKRAGAPFTLLGHSLGAIVALKASVLVPESIRKIISVGGLPEPLPVVKTRMRERAALVRQNGMPGSGDTVLPAMLGERALREMPDKVFLLRRLLEMNDAQGYASMADALATVSAHEEALNLRVPFMAITGSEDRSAPPLAVENFLSTLIAPHRHRILPGCGHLPFFEAPQEFNQAVLEMLSA